MKKIIFFSLSLIFILVSCSKESSVVVADVQESPRSLDSINNNYALYESLHELYFNFFSGGIDEAFLESEVLFICEEYGFDVNYYDSCEISELCLDYLEQIRESVLVSINDLSFMFDDEVLSNEEKLSLCITAAAINYLNQYIDVHLVMETNTGKFLIEKNPMSYINDYGLNITNQNIIIYQPYATGTFSLLEFSNSSDFATSLNTYYANEETEIDCLHTYMENVERLERELEVSIAASIPIIFVGGLKSYMATLLCCLIEYKFNKNRCWAEFEDCLESIQKVIFIQC